MTIGMKHAPRRLALPAAAMAAMLLAGCSSGNIGESWQCPLAKGGSCGSVAAADPAVPDAAGRTVLKAPLWRVRTGAPADRPEEPACEAECGGGFDPLGWLMRLFGSGEEEAAEPGAPAAKPDAAAPTQNAESPAAKPAAAALPAEPARGEGDPDGESLRGDGLRTGEVVARIWIAPFVDGDGVYREASHVRVVLEPAGWRLPR